MDWNVSSKQVTASNGAVVRFDYDIRGTAHVDGVLIVILEVPPGHVMTENVFGVSRGGKLLWQIERSAANSTDPENRYICVTGHSRETARIYSWSGMNSGIDVHTGRIVDTQVAK